MFLLKCVGKQHEWNGGGGGGGKKKYVIIDP